MSETNSNMQIQEGSNIPAFLVKLWKMVNDPNTDEVICWNETGTGFVIQNKAYFWYELLPLYYKHNNMSSFVRQLNMYGFHKLSTVENGTMDVDKDETQFSHPLFKKNRPELLGYIKRKVTNPKPNENVSHTIIKQDDITKVLTDVKQMKGRQNKVDQQLSALKEENVVLWRELALLRQKHMKQQQIVNKLIQFLVTLAHTNQSTRIGVGVKRRMPLMINESPNKKPATNKTKKIPTSKTSSTTGPTIHEIDAVGSLPEDIFENMSSEPIINSPETPESMTSTQGTQRRSSIEANNPENSKSENHSNLDNNVFLNPAARDTVLSSLTNGSYNPAAVANANRKNAERKANEADSEMTVATRINNVDDFDLHLENSQSELECLKDLLSGCTSLDANTLLGLFNDESLNYGIPNYESERQTSSEAGDVIDSKIALPTTIDFNELFDSELDDDSNVYTDSQFSKQPEDDSGTINTPVVTKSDPFFKN
ncbi:heat shock factor protein isoform X2 [Aethina tumida]|uniref:heat shock factor protein isoform X2 n=1 Tax=Aethina tumida TaxID=116153 RepID=UPI00096B39BE|nr:heat shock factor protein isoform X2 [Aethina tumida]